MSHAFLRLNLATFAYTTLQYKHNIRTFWGAIIFFFVLSSKQETQILTRISPFRSVSKSRTNKFYILQCMYIFLIYTQGS
jgi:hypothetical protein